MQAVCAVTPFGNRSTVKYPLCQLYRQIKFCHALHPLSVGCSCCTQRVPATGSDYQMVMVSGNRGVIMKVPLVNSHFVTPVYARIQESQADGFRPSPE